MMLGGNRFVVAVVDKMHPERVVWKAVPTKGGSVPAPWRSLAGFTQDEPMAYQVAMLNYDAFRAKGADDAIKSLSWGKEHAETVRKIWSELATMKSPSHFDRAIWSLDRHAAPGARAVAAKILLNFLDRDLSWWALMDALRDPDDRVKTAAWQTLIVAQRGMARPVDWRPAATSIAHLLNGTNVSALSTVAKVLVATAIDPELSASVCAMGAHALIASVGAQSEHAHDPARKLLERLTAQSHGRKADDWRAALSALRRD